MKFHYVSDFGGKYFHTFRSDLNILLYKWILEAQ